MLNSEKDIADSIRYALNIQTALLPDLTYFKKLLPDSFILYKPRDVVSGDFYWVSKILNRIVVVAADCTGHGVPGAFMSIMSINFLNQIVTHCVPASNKILNQLREYVMKALHQKGAEGEQKDGLDIALCVIDLEKKHIEFSGANNPIIYFKDDELRIIKGDRMPIGVGAIEEESFQKHIIPFAEIDSFYIFSDGYHDQFGGPRFKKLKYIGFKDYLNKAHSLQFDKQGKNLENKLDKWIGNGPQIDDILLIGICLDSFKG